MGGLAREVSGAAMAKRDGGNGGNVWGGVERGMGFCGNAEFEEFMRQAPECERHLVRSGVHLFKVWFPVSREEQRRRF
jgi:hypothetical protein